MSEMLPHFAEPTYHVFAYPETLNDVLWQVPKHVFVFLTPPSGIITMRISVCQVISYLRSYW